MQSDKNWEKICRRCGRCCYEKIEFEANIYYTNIPCDKLDLNTRFCTVYEKRTEIKPGCVKLIPALVKKGFLPADCPYVEGIKDYHAPYLWGEWEEDEV